MISYPQHIAIIMDGNARWSIKKGVDKNLGYNQGIMVAENIVNFCKKIGVKFLTLYAFSMENWSREKKEVDDLMALMSYYLHEKASELVNNDIRILFIGSRSKLTKEMQNKMRDIELISSSNSFTLIIAISYGSRNEIREAALAFAEEKLKNRDISPIDFDRYINPNQIPDPDLLIRTSGEQRLSNFLLWQLAYTELYFSQKLWPDFSQDDLLEAINDFQLRKRRYGK